MGLTRWRVEYDGIEWGADGTSIEPPELAAAIAEIDGEEQVTYFGKPYTPDPTNADTVYEFFASEVNPQGEGTILVWDYVDGPEEAMTARGVVF